MTWAGGIAIAFLLAASIRYMLITPVKQPRGRD